MPERILFNKDGETLRYIEDGDIVELVYENNIGREIVQCNSRACAVAAGPFTRIPRIRIYTNPLIVSEVRGRVKAIGGMIGEHALLAFEWGLWCRFFEVCPGVEGFMWGDVAVELGEPNP
jgi:hypothetical protein